METAAAVEIDQGGLRRYFLEDFHRCLEKPRTTLGFSTVTTGSAAINQKPTTNKTGQITCYQNRTFLLATDSPHLHRDIPAGSQSKVLELVTVRDYPATAASFLIVD